MRVSWGQGHEHRWALSQKVQGTASLIFKEALLGLSNEFGHNAILLPMHDAVLLQFERGHTQENKLKAKQIMIEAMQHRCPGVRPRVIPSAF